MAKSKKQKLKDRARKAEPLVKKFYRYMKLRDNEANDGYHNPFRNDLFEFTGDINKVHRYERLADKAEEQLKKLGYYYDPSIGFKYKE